jgi:cyclopropane fatty-acyl-phospholipid synthase-like methyltransferase
MTNIPTRQNFADAYASEAPWDIGRPQSAITAAADKVVGPLLDAGCGTGDAALFFAERGLEVTGIDYLEEAIQRARTKAAERGLNVTFRVQNALELENSSDQFTSVIDCGLFHVFADDDRKRYVRGLATVLKPDGCLFLMCFSDAEPPGAGPRRISRKDLEQAFSDGWQIESVESTRFEINPKFPDINAFSAGGPQCWFAIIQRK